MNCTQNSTAILAPCFNSRGYRTYWQEYEVNFITSLGVFCWVCGKKHKLHFYIYYTKEVLRKSHGTQYPLKHPFAQRAPPLYVLIFLNQLEFVRPG
jgi:hypothetical protein